jgi:thiamine biosynthesis lipoprotein
MSELDFSFAAMGSHVRLLIGEPGEGCRTAEAAAEDARRFVAAFDRRLSRFRPDSALCELNGDPRPRVPGTALLRQAVQAGLWAADRSGGLVDPTLIGDVEAAGYTASRQGVAGAPLAEALAVAPPRRPARPHPDARWREFSVDDRSGTIERPPGLRFDSGGIGKGLAADLVAARLHGFSRYVVDCGGDIRIGGADALAHPYEIAVEHPLTGERAHVLRIGRGGVATSGLNVRIWRHPDGGFAHHLIDPSCGEPAWTGLVGATALGDTALEAETLSKAALLSGPERAREVLSEHGGLLVHEGGRVELVGPFAVRPLIRLPAGAPGERLEAAA